MLKIAKIAIVVNVLLALLFIYSNLSLWTSINGKGLSLLIASYWNPIGVSAMHYSYVNGDFTTVQAIFHYWNFPFWIFFVAIAVNLYFIYKLSGRKNLH
jgi:hypothetical protein